MRNALLAAAILAGAGGAARAQDADVFFYCLGLNPETGAMAASNVFPGRTAALDTYKQQIASYLISLDLLPEAGGEVACAWAATEAAAQQELQGSITPSDVRFAYAPQLLGAGAAPAGAVTVREPDAVELPDAELAAIEAHNRREAIRAAALEAERQAREQARREAEAAQQAQYEAANAEYLAAQAAFQQQQQQYQQDLARQQAATAEYERQRAAFEAAVAAGATPVPGPY